MLAESGMRRWRPNSKNDICGSFNEILITVAALPLSFTFIQMSFTEQLCQSLQRTTAAHC
jgi:hypothetical protein